MFIKLKAIEASILSCSMFILSACSSPKTEDVPTITTLADECQVIQNQPTDCGILNNDIYDDSVNITINIVNKPEFGSLSVHSGKVIYTPLTGYAGADSFSYRILQGNSESESAKVNLTIQRVSPQSPIYTAGWENGQLDSGLPGKLTASFSNDLTSLTEEHSDLHYYQAEKVDWARTGEHIVKFFGKPPAYRSETAFMDSLYRYSEGDEFFFSTSIRPDQSWDEPTKYSIIISQWKSFSSGPHAALRLSNMGDYVLSFHAKDYPPIDLGIAPANEWTDIRIYFKKSLAEDGKVMVWVNGELKLERNGKTLISSNDGYTKIGMYTEIRSPRTIYFDNTEVSKAINRPLHDWGESPVNGSFDDSDEDGIANGLDPFPFDSDRF